MLAGICCALAVLFAGAAVLSPYAVMRARRSGACAAGLACGAAATILAAAYYGWQVGDYYAKHASRSFPGVSLGSRGEGLAGYHSLLALTCLMLAGLMIRRRIARHRRGNVAAGVFGFLAAVFAAGTLVITIPRAGNELIMLWIILAPVTAGGALALVVTSLVLFVRSVRAKEPPEPEAGTLCPACQYDLTGNVSGRCPECGQEVPQSIRDRVAPAASMVPEASVIEPTWPTSLAKVCDAWGVVLAVVAILKVTPLGFFAFSAVPFGGLRLSLMMSVHPALLDVAAAVLLMVGAHGIGRRKRWGIVVCLVWAAVSASLAVFDVTSMPAYWSGALRGGFQWTGHHVQTAAWKLVWGFAFPSFLAVWFATERVRRDVRGWRGAADPSRRQ